MLEHQKKGLRKTLSMLLSVAMLLTSPIGITQAYALEDGQPTVVGSQEELPLGTSVEVQSSGVLDSGTLSEASAVPAFAEDYPKLGTEQADGSKKIEVLIKGILPEGVTEMSIGYTLLSNIREMCCECRRSKLIALFPKRHG